MYQNNIIIAYNQFKQHIQRYNSLLIYGANIKTVPSTLLSVVYTRNLLSVSLTLKVVKCMVYTIIGLRQGERFRVSIT